MKRFVPVVCLSILAMMAAKAQDPAKVDPTHYKVILNNKGRYLGRFLALK